MAEPIRLGIAGLGMAGLAFIPAIAAHPGFQLVAVAEPDGSVAVPPGVARHDDLAAMLRQDGLDGVIIATPTPLHAAHTLAVLAAGRHVVLEKPMACDLGQALAMAEAADMAGRVVLIGHSHSFDLPIRRMRALIDEGSLGRVRMINTWCFSDWMYRPRRPDELVVATGGGVTLRQGAHQIDVIRLLGGGLLRSVRAQTFDWDPARRAIGAHSAWMEFTNGAAASAIYNGYGGFDTAELTAGITEWGFHQPQARPSSRVPDANQAQAKRARANASDKSDAPFQPHFGITVASCERGDIRQSPEGLIVYSAAGRREIAFAERQTPHRLVLDELLGAIVRGVKPLHDARWGLANLETCLAMIASAETGASVALRHQVAA